MDNGKGRIIRMKAFTFALWVVKLATYLQGEKKEFALSKWAFGCCQFGLQYNA
jgi:hypothetical protein